MATTSALPSIRLVTSPSTYTNRISEHTNQVPKRIITLEEVSWHDNYSDCWVVIYDRVYDITDFLKEHPGGYDIIIENAGRDATIAFRGTGHSIHAVRGLNRFLIGELPLEECIFRKAGGYRLSDLPD